MIRLYLLGQPDLRGDDGTSILAVLSQPRRLALLAVLALSGRRGIGRERLASLFWPDSSDPRGRSALNQAIHFLRRELGEEAVTSRGDGTVLLTPERVWCDATELQDALARGDSAGAAELYEGNLLEGFSAGVGRELEGFFEEERASIRRLAMRACWDASALAEAEGRTPDALRHARRAAGLAPLEEISIQRLMGVLARAGDRAAAVSAFEEFRVHLGSELELEPSPATVALVEEIRGRAGSSPAGAMETEDAAPPRATPPAAGEERDGRDLATSPHAARTALTTPASRGASPRRPWLRSRAPLAAVAAVATLGAGWGVLAFGRGTGAEMATAVAVLPSRLLTADSTERAFGEGLQEEILTQLTKIEGITLRSPQSVALAGARDVPLGELAGLLDVRYVLDLSVQRDGSRVKVTARLVDAVEDEHVWGETLVRPGDDAFGVQGEVAARVAEAMGVRVTSSERRALASVPTRDREAWEAYLAGRAWERTGLHGASYERERVWPEAVSSFRLATERDASFGLAWGRLAMGYLRLYWWGLDPGGTAVSDARGALERAVAVDPDLPEVRLAQAYYRYWAESDFEGAWQVASTLDAQLPGDVDLVALLGAVARRTGRLEESIRFWERCTELDPLNSFWHGELLSTLLALRRFQEVETHLARIEPLFEPGRFSGTHWTLALAGQGDPDEALRVLSDVPPEERWRFWGLEFGALWMGRRYEEALDVLEREARPSFRIQEGELPIDLMYGLVHGLEGREGEAHRRLAAALPGVRESVETHPRRPALRVFLAVALAGTGRCSEALAELERAEDLASGDRWHRPHIVNEGLPVRVQCGDVDGVIARLPGLLGSSCGSCVTVPWLRTDPRYDPVRGDPRFQDILARHG